MIAEEIFVGRLLCGLLRVPDEDPDLLSSASAVALNNTCRARSQDRVRFNMVVFLRIVQVRDAFMKIFTRAPVLKQGDPLKTKVPLGSFQNRTNELR